MHISEAQNKAVHSETAIASAARLAGSLLFRSFGLNIPDAQPGTVVLSNEANEEGPELINIMSAMLHHFGITLHQERLNREEGDYGAATELSVIESLALLQDDAMRIAECNGLGLKEAAQAAALCTAFIVKECSRNLSAEVSFTVATYGFIEGCKTVPPAFRSELKSPVQKKPWYKLWLL